MTIGAPLLQAPDMSETLLSRTAEPHQESLLQELIDRCPTILPIHDFYPNVEGLCSLGREIPVPVADGADGYIDNLLVTDDAHLVIVETKLWRNSEAVRDVVAQILQYAMGVSQLSLDEFENRLRRGDVKSQRLGPDESVYRRATSLPQRADDFEDAFDRLRRNGDILLLIVADCIRSSAERLVQWMNNAVGAYKLGLVEFRIYDLPDTSRIIVPKTLLKISEASRHVVTISMQGTASEQVTVTFTAPGESSKKTKLSPPPTPMTEERLTAQIRANNPPDAAELAEGLRQRLRSSGFATRTFPSQISYGIEVDEDFISLLSMTPTNMWFSIPIRAVRVLGEQRFITCKQRINEVAEFYRREDESDATKTTALAPRFRVLDGKLDAFVEAFTEVAETVKGAMAEPS
ncbi:MAG: hypothetical protein HYX72_03405 [Acidobacteria bacterium]|nr:hypothetical protein [Acidobacteriota bacterium]